MIVTLDVGYRDDEVDLTGIFISDDKLTEKCPGILVVHGGAGLDEHAKGRARGFSEAGFVVFSCDMYGNGVAGDRQRVMTTLMDLRKNAAKLRRRVRAGLEVLISHALVDHRIAAVGYCFGGLTVLELARSGAEVLGVVSVHGSLDTSQPSEPGAVKAKVLVCHGGLDPHVPMSQVNSFVEEMRAVSADLQLIIYGGREAQRQESIERGDRDEDGCKQKAESSPLSFAVLMRLQSNAMCWLPETAPMKNVLLPGKIRQQDLSQSARVLQADSFVRRALVIESQKVSLS